MLEKNDYNSIINSLLVTFQNYDFISYDYLNSLIEAILNDEQSYDNLPIYFNKDEETQNNALYFEMGIKNFIYLKICKSAQLDADVLVFLVDELMKKALLVFKKMNVSDISKAEDYIIDAINNYDGLEAFTSYLTKYIVAKIKGVPYVHQEKVETKAVDTPVTPRKYNKKKPKKQKNKNKKDKSKSEIDNISAISEKEMVIDDSTLEDKTIGEVDATPETIVDEFDPEVVEEEKGQDVSSNSIEDNTDNEAKIVDVDVIYEKMKALCQNKKGSAVKDEFLSLAIDVDIIKWLSSSNELFMSYLVLRFRRINNSYFDLNEISSLLEIDVRTVLKFEKIVIAALKKIMDCKFDNYSAVAFKKTLEKDF